MGEIDQVIFNLFSDRWVESNPFVTKDIDSMKKQLHKNLRDQVNGYWSGHTAYHLMVGGGFLIDAKSGTKKKLTAFGQVFMDNYCKIEG